MSVPGLGWIVCCGLVGPPATDVEQSVAAELARLRERAERQSAETLGRPADLVHRLVPLKRGLELGFVEDTLRRLGPVRQAILTADFQERHRPEVGTIAELEPLFARVKEEMQAGAARGAPIPEDRPVARQALIRSERAQAWTYLPASLAQGKATRVDAGLYYLGAAWSHADFARFLQALPDEPVGAPPPELPGLDRLLKEVEEQLLELYEPPAALGGHREFIQASAELKFARELRAAGADFAALDQVLDACRGVHRLRAAGLDAEPSRISASLEESRIELGSEDRDHGLALARLESAERLVLEAEEREAEEGEGELQDAAIVVDHLIPAYLAATRPALDPLPDTPPTFAITLVRWPFT